MLAHLNAEFPTGILNSKIEDSFQDLLLRIWNPGITIIGERSLWALKFHARREMIRIAREDRRKRSYPSGGMTGVDCVNENEISAENQLDLLIEVIAFCEEYGCDLQQGLDTLDEKRRAIADSLIKQAAFEPSARQVFEGMTPAEQRLFGTSRETPKKGPAKKKAIRAVSRRVREVQEQLGASCGRDSRVKKSLLAKLRG